MDEGNLRNVRAQVHDPMGCWHAPPAVQVPTLCKGEAMSDKDAVLSRFPDAVCEVDEVGAPVHSRSCSVWDGPRRPDNFRGCWGHGSTPAEAWATARRNIEIHAGRKIP